MTEWLVSSAVLAAVLIGAHYLLRGKISARLQYALWLVLLVRLLLPLSVGKTALSVANLLPKAEPATVMQAEPAAAPPAQAASAPEPAAPAAPVQTPAQPVQRPASTPAQAETGSAEPENAESLQLFGFICELAFDVFLKKQMIERLADELRAENPPKKKK